MRALRNKRKSARIGHNSNGLSYLQSKVGTAHNGMAMGICVDNDLAGASCTREGTQYTQLVVAADHAASAADFYEVPAFRVVVQVERGPLLLPQWCPQHHLHFHHLHVHVLPVPHHQTTQNLQECDVEGHHGTCHGNSGYHKAINFHIIVRKRTKGVQNTSSKPLYAIQGTCG